MKTHSRKGSDRRPRLASVLERSLQEYFQTEMELPGLVSISHIDVVANMQFATVWLSIYAADEEAVLKTVGRESGKIRKFLTKELVSKYIPQLSFKADPSEAHADTISRKLKELE